METVTTQILPDGEIYGVKVGDGNKKWFSHFDEDGYPCFSPVEHTVTKSEAFEIAEKIGDGADVVQLLAGPLGFWVRSKSGDSFEDCKIQVGEPVREYHDNVPDWFLKRMMAFEPDAAAWDDLEPENRHYALDVFSRESEGNWLDHTGWSGVGESSVFVAEPYQVTQADVEDLVAVCRKFGFKFTMSGKSSHYPSSTLRIEIFPEAQ